jgi:hypothetical protein
MRSADSLSVILFAAILLGSKELLPLGSLLWKDRGEGSTDKVSMKPHAK